MASAADSPSAVPARPRVSAAKRREELIDAALHEFALTGLHGTTVGRIARRVGVAQPYVFALFQTKLDLFLATVERGFDRTVEAFRAGAREASERRGREASGGILQSMGHAYKELLASDRDFLMFQQQAYAACREEAVRDRMRRRYAELFRVAHDLSDASAEQLDEFFRQGMGHLMTQNVAVAMGVEALSVRSEWVHADRERSDVR